MQILQTNERSEVKHPLYNQSHAIRTKLDPVVSSFYRLLYVQLHITAGHLSNSVSLIRCRDGGGVTISPQSGRTCWV